MNQFNQKLLPNFHSIPATHSNLYFIYVRISCIKNTWTTQYSKPFEVQKNNSMVKFLVKVDLLFVCTIRPTVQWSSCVETPGVWKRGFLHKIIILLVTHYVFRRVASKFLSLLQEKSFLYVFLSLGISIPSKYNACFSYLLCTEHSC